MKQSGLSQSQITTDNKQGQTEVTRTFSTINRQEPKNSVIYNYQTNQFQQNLLPQQQKIIAQVPSTIIPISDSQQIQKYSQQPKRYNHFNYQTRTTIVNQKQQTQQTIATTEIKYAVNSNNYNLQQILSLHLNNKPQNDSEEQLTKGLTILDRLIQQNYFSSSNVDYLQFNDPADLLDPKTANLLPLWQTTQIQGLIGQFLQFNPQNKQFFVYGGNYENKQKKGTSENNNLIQSIIAIYSIQNLQQPIQLRQFTSKLIQLKFDSTGHYLAAVFSDKIQIFSNEAEILVQAKNQILNIFIEKNNLTVYYANSAAEHYLLQHDKAILIGQDDNCFEFVEIENKKISQFKKITKKFFQTQNENKDQNVQLDQPNLIIQQEYLIQQTPKPAEFQFIEKNFGIGKNIFISNQIQQLQQTEYITSYDTSPFTTLLALGCSSGSFYLVNKKINIKIQTDLTSILDIKFSVNNSSQLFIVGDETVICYDMNNRAIIFKQVLNSVKKIFFDKHYKNLLISINQNVQFYKLSPNLMKESVYQFKTVKGVKQKVSEQEVEQWIFNEEQKKINQIIDQYELEGIRALN